MRLTAPKTSFVAGVVTTLALLGMAGVGLQFAAWVAAHPSLASVVAWLRAPRFSVLGVAGVVGGVVALWMMVKMLIYGPRP